jgi:hypothetical protein
VQIAKLCDQRVCPFGDAALQFHDTVLAAETCEELFIPMAPNIRHALSGASPSPKHMHAVAHCTSRNEQAGCTHWQARCCSPKLPPMTMVDRQLHAFEVGKPNALGMHMKITIVCACLDIFRKL